jgi:hypothetical protein
MVVVLQEQKTAALLLVQLFVQMVSWSYRSPGFPPWTEGNDGGKMRQGPRLARANDWQNGREVVVVNGPGCAARGEWIGGGSGSSDAAIVPVLGESEGWGFAQNGSEAQRSAAALPGYLHSRALHSTAQQRRRAAATAAGHGERALHCGTTHDGQVNQNPRQKYSDQLHPPAD